MVLGTSARWSRAALALPPMVVAALALPFILHQNSGWEWANPYWLLQRQAEHVSATGTPTLFLHFDSGAFAPFYLYYAGPLLSVLAYPATVFGAWPVFVATTLAAMVAGYFGIWQTARNLGLSSRLAVLPALTFSATPYVVSNLYGRGAWAELIAVNMMAVLLGGLSAVLLRPRGSDRGALVAITAATAVLAGTHNLTLMLAGLVLPFILLALLWLRAPDAAPLPSAIGRAAAAVGLGVALVAAWLLPNLWYGGDTVIAQGSTSDSILEESYGGATSLPTLLSLWPRVPHAFSERWIYPQAPSLVLVAVVAIVAVALWRRRRPAIPAVALAVLAAALLVVAAHPAWWTHFPAPLRTVQYPFRLMPYVSVIVALGAVVGLRALGSPRWAVALLGVAVVLQVVAGAFVAVHSKAAGIGGVASPRVSEVHAYSEPPALGPTMLSQVQFRVFGRPTMKGRISGQATVQFADQLTDDVVSVVGIGRPGEHVGVPVVWSPFVRISGGAELTGRDGEGLAIVTVRTADAAGQWTAEASAASPWPLTAGRVISAAALLLLAAVGVTRLVRRLRRSRRLDDRAQTPERAPALVK